ncbi:hypothetical protein L873DRAFT_1794033 [Choiromyces venosus 120613-1]|uniref:Glycoside hydrolase n=1 Tax=Choiromyces venosus 120613-1 TaxID=1336337 RepID=A0A3N4J807_9PEZI|nr:hypothetical protein L873DRAFT_1794033 [Choiromyces venosus 120613-1]
MAKLEDAGIDQNILANDIRELASIGAGGLEFLPYYLHGGGPGVPAEAGEEVLAWDVHRRTYKHPIDGTLPGWGRGQLVSAASGLIVKDALPVSVIAHDSLQDITGMVELDGSISIEFSSDQTAIEYTIWAIYVNHSNYRATRPGNDPQTLIQNGPWARLSRGFCLAWDDSIEIRANVYWTKSLLEAFSEARGYPINKYLPIIFHDHAGHFGPSDSPWWVTGETDGGQSHIEDYRLTLLELYRAYLQALNDWSHDYLNMQFSCQVADIAQKRPHRDAPETESYAFNHEIDAYRQFAGPAHLAGKRIISSELAAAFDEAYQHTLPALLGDVKTSFAVGINQFVFHDTHQRHPPPWEYHKDSIDFTARLQYIGQIEVPRRDLVFWQKNVAVVTLVAKNYQGWDLVEAGNDHSGSFTGIQWLMLGFVEECASAGWPVIFQGGLPSQLYGFNESGQSYVNSTINSIKSLPNVQIISFNDSLVATTASMGITPLTAISANGTWYTCWRSNTQSGIDYVYIFNDSPYSEGTTYFASTGIPYVYDAWAGQQSSLHNYTSTVSSTSI